MFKKQKSTNPKAQRSLFPDKGIHQSHQRRIGAGCGGDTGTDRPGISVQPHVLGKHQPAKPAGYHQVPEW
jgi:hypothetical protein